MGDFKQQAIENEAHLIGTIIAVATRSTPRGFALLAQAADLTPEDFKDPRHQFAWQTMRTLLGRNVAPNTANLYAELTATGQALELQRYILDLRLSAPDADDVSAIVGAIRMVSRLRRAVRMAEEVLATANTVVGGEVAPLDGCAYIDELSDTYASKRGRNHSRPQVEHGIRDGFEEGLAARRERGGALVGITTGIGKVDEWTGGLRPGVLTLAGALSGVGKTSFGVHLSVMAAESGRRAVFYSLEMSEDAMQRRIGCHICGIPYRQLERLSASEVKMLAARISEVPITLHYTGPVSVLDLIGFARMQVHENDVGLIVIDHLQLIEWDGEKDAPRFKQLGVISRRLEALSASLNVPIVVTCQLNPPAREKGGRADPSADDMRDSKEPYNNCGVFMALHSKRDKDGPTGEDHILVQKNRFGPVGRVRILYDYATARMREWVIPELRQDRTQPREPDAQMMLPIEKEKWN